MADWALGELSKEVDDEQTFGRASLSGEKKRSRESLFGATRQRARHCMVDPASLESLQVDLLSETG
jgi:hypothetical protein